MPKPPRCSYPAVFRLCRFISESSIQFSLKLRQLFFQVYDVSPTGAVGAKLFGSFPAVRVVLHGLRRS